MPEQSFDLIMIGGGIGGSGLATVMQRAGYSCLVLEKTARFRDVTKGEWIAPWGVVELNRTGLIEPISDWVLAEACRQCAEWREGGLDLYTSVNLPARFWEPTAMGRVLDTIRSFGLNPSSVMIEITESAAMANPERNEATISKLRERGLRVAIDDFGTGHSSLSRLNQMLVSILKIDMSFVRDVPGDPTAASLVAAIIQLGQSLGLTALAEGVETEAQRQFLVGAGCPLGQGYHFSRPVPAEQIPEPGTVTTVIIGIALVVFSRRKRFC